MQRLVAGVLRRCARRPWRLKPRGSPNGGPRWRAHPLGYPDRRAADADARFTRGSGIAPARRLKPRAHARKPAAAGSLMRGFLRISHGRARPSPLSRAHARAVPTCSTPTHRCLKREVWAKPAKNLVASPRPSALQHPPSPAGEGGGRGGRGTTAEARSFRGLRPTSRGSGFNPETAAARATSPRSSSRPTQPTR
jgi:hypothetical protein